LDVGRLVAVVGPGASQKSRENHPTLNSNLIFQNRKEMMSAYECIERSKVLLPYSFQGAEERNEFAGEYSSRQHKLADGRTDECLSVRIIGLYMPSRIMPPAAENSEAGTG
jgi:hypothetical protein